MKATVHRGTREIGGTLIELQTGGTRLLLDAGYPLLLGGNPISDSVAKLPPEELLAQGVLPPIAGLYKWDAPNIDGILISHAHVDHYGLLKYAHPDIPVYLSAGTQTLIALSQRFKICEPYPVHARQFAMYEPFMIGGFTVIPYLMDHSAFDAAAFVIEAEGKTVIYTGDFRGHGRKAGCLEGFLRRAPKDADVLFSEGSLVSRGDERVVTEVELEDAVVSQLEGKPGIALVQASSQNIDRLVSFYKAAQRLRRTFVVDVYTANVLQALRALGNNIPYPSYSGMKVFYPNRLTQRIYDEIGSEYARQFSAYHISRAEVSQRQDGIIMLVRPSMMKDLARCALRGGTCFYSMWQGYRAGAGQQAFESWLQDAGIAIEPMHTSGHAKVSDIRLLIDTLRPQKIIPVHTMEPEAFTQYSDKVALQSDGIMFEI